MKQYQFTGLEINERGDSAYLPPEAMFIETDDVGVPIEDQIDGYQTLNVTGRELMPYSVSSQAVSGYDGELFLGADHPKRELTIKYQLIASSDQEYREKFARLNYLLSPKQMHFYFFDDPQFEYVGTLSGATNPNPGTNVVNSEFTITLLDPFKRLKNNTIYRGGQSIRINEPAYYPTVPDKIELTIKSANNHLEITNFEQTISLTGSFSVGDKVTIDFTGDAQILLNSVNRLDLLNLNSDFENFAVKQGSVITCSNSSNLTLQLRRKEL